MSTVLSAPLAAQETAAPVPAAASLEAAIFGLPAALPATPPVCGSVQNIPIFTTTGTTCVGAQNNLKAILSTYTGCECGFCTEIYIIKQCYVVTGGYEVSGYMRYSCKGCPL